MLETSYAAVTYRIQHIMNAYQNISVCMRVKNDVSQNTVTFICHSIKVSFVVDIL